MEPIAKERAQDILRPYLERLNKVIAGKLNYYYSGPQYAAVRHEHTARSDASICHDLVWRGLITEFENDPSVRLFKSKGLMLMKIRDTVVLRFNKFDHNLLSANSHTHQSSLFNLQEVGKLEFEGMPPDGLLYVGYIPNELETGVGEIHVTYRYADTNIWSWEISTETVADTISFPAAVASQATTTRKPKIKGKEKNVGDLDAGNL
ncbi:hypothetical protein D3C75_400040 [compost metagenome]